MRVVVASTVKFVRKPQESRVVPQSLTLFAIKDIFAGRYSRGG
jgi:hypothetical protein